MLCTFCEAVAQVKEGQQDISVRHPGSGVGAVKLMPSGTVIGVSPDVLDLSKESHNTSNDESLVSAESYQNPPSDDILTRCSSGQSSHISTEMSTAQGSTRQVADSSTTSMSSIRSLPSTPRRTVCSTPVNSSTKPPNIIIFSDSPSASECVKAALELTLVNDRYVIHKLTFAEMLSTTWPDDAILVVIHGNVPAPFKPVVMNYLAKGSGSLLCLCSDFLGSILPMFHTAEVRPNELVHCSYKSWKHVPLMHHVFCYQPTPSDAKFSYDEQVSLRAIPESVVIKDSDSKSHKLKMTFWGSKKHGKRQVCFSLYSLMWLQKVVFSQVHLETAPDQFEDTDNKREALTNSDKARLEILSDVLCSHLELKCAPKKSSSIGYSLGYFLGNHEAKLELIEKLKEDKKIENNVLTNGLMKMKFCGKGVTPPPPSESMLPILIHSCPESFSTVEYYENLKTESIGRLVIFSEVMSSCLSVIDNLNLVHGLAVIPFYQTKGVGRSGNTWLSPKGSAMFTIQVHIPLKSYLGQHLSILQFIATLAIVASICELPNLEDLDVGIKWPNDIYVNKSTKMGGVALKTTIFGDKAVVNMGCGINLNNKEPTVCLNDVITSLSKEKNVKIPRLSFEKYFSGVFNKMEQIINIFNEGRTDEFYRSYYQYWLHSDAEVKVTNEDKSTQLVKITGIDEFGFLTAETAKGVTITVQPDGNSFDMMAGLISPKLSQ
uniref:Biotin--protein ligase n=4 Tax=Lygus hesperus TaxID=30085 RepID=A0A0A9YRX0_LYGHE